MQSRVQQTSLHRDDKYTLEQEGRCTAQPAMPSKPLQGQVRHRLHVSHSRLLLALRCAVSQPVQPRLRSAPSSATVDRPRFAPSWRVAPTDRSGSSHEISSQLGFIQRHTAKLVRPNRSLNRTLCGGPGLGFKSLAQTRPTAKCRLA